MTKYKIGRASNNDIVIVDDSKTVSSEHAVIEMLKDKFYLTDNSINGTYVNGKKIPNGIRFPVSEKDTILFANKYPFQWKMVKKVKTNRSTFKVNPNLTKPILITGSIVLFGYFIITILLSNNLFSYDTKDLYEKYNKSVVLINHSYFYTIELEGKPMYFIGINSKGEYDYDKQKSKLYPLNCEGTGFFTSKKGEIITNRHVAYPWITKANEIEFSKSNPELYNVYSNCIKKVNKSLARYSRSDLSPSLSGETNFLGVALNNSFVNSLDEFTKCVQVKHHDDLEIDLALMQTMEKVIPDAATFIDVKNSKIKYDIKVGNKATIIGFPGGTMFQKNNGKAFNIQAITTDGKISQKPSDKEVMYNITTTGGASGSPVFNEKGKLFAVHYAGFQGKQGYNSGILSKYIKDLLN